MMKKFNLLNLTFALGILFCSFNVQAMEREEDNVARSLTQPKKKNMWVFDFCALDNATKAIYPNENFPKEVIIQICNTIVSVKEDYLCHYLERKDLEKFYKLNRRRDGVNNYSIKSKLYCHYKGKLFIVNEESGGAFVVFYYYQVLKPKQKFEAQTLQVVDFDHETCTYLFGILPEMKNTISFTLTYVNKAYAGKMKNYALACFDNLSKTPVGEHQIDLFKSYEDYLKAHPCGDGKEWSWAGLSPSGYAVYDRRMAYEAASEERKREMEAEIPFVRNQDYGFLSTILMGIECAFNP